MRKLEEGFVRRCCIITGGAGFIGTAISGKIADVFSDVIAVDNLHPQVHSSATRPAALDTRVNLLTGDIVDRDLWETLLSDVTPDVVIHLAAETGTAQSLTEGTRHATVNVAGMTTMLDAFARHGKIPKKIILTSSRAVYGEGAWKEIETGRIIYPKQRPKRMLEKGLWDFPSAQSLPFEAKKTHPYPTSVYGATKLAQEQILKSWADAMGAIAVVLRLQNVYGPGQSLNNPYTGIVPLFARLAKEGRSIPVYEDGKILRDFVFIDDVVEAILRAVAESDLDTDPYDVGTGQMTTILELAEIISRYYASLAPSVTGQFRAGDVRSASCHVERTKHDLKWTPRVSVEEGMRMVCGWIDNKKLG